VEGASVEELNQKIHTLEKEKNKEEEYRNYMQLERVRHRALGTCGSHEQACRTQERMLLLLCSFSDSVLQPRPQRYAPKKAMT